MKNNNLKIINDGGYLDVFFKQNNIVEFKKQFDKHQKWKSENTLKFLNGHPGNPRMPEFTFYYDGKEPITPGYYDFDVDDVSFNRCYIEPWYSDDNGKTWFYRTGSYFVHMNR